MPALDWLTARPVAHRGLHDAAKGIIENTSSAVSAAIAAGYAIEVDLQITADSEAMVHHDDALGRLNEGSARLDSMTAADLKRVSFKATQDRMMTLSDLCDLVAERVTGAGAQEPLRPRSPAGRAHGRGAAAIQGPGRS